MNNFNIYSRRQFLGRSAKIGMAAALSTLVDIPFVMKRALAEGSIGPEPGTGRPGGGPAVESRAHSVGAGSSQPVPAPIDPMSTPYSVVPSSTICWNDAS